MEFDTDKIEFYIIQSLLRSDVYIRTFSSKMTPDLFSVDTQKIVRAILSYYKRYLKSPDVSILEDKGIPQICKDAREQEKAKDVLDAALSINFDIVAAQEWMDDETKKFIKTRTIMNAFIKCVDKVEDHESHSEIVTIMENAFKINFDESLGMEYFDGLEERHERSAISTKVYTTGIPTLDEYTGGGYRKKSFWVFAGPSNTGKTLCLNDAASTLALAGHNVLYLTLELGEDYISQRTDAKFAEIPMKEVNIRPQDAIKKAIVKRDLMRGKGQLGKLYYKEYAPNEVSCNDIRALLKQYQMKRDFIPDFIIVDYLKLIRPNGKVFSDNAYGKIVTICEELRALACEYDCCVLSASQTGRQSFGARNVGMEDISDSIGIVQTADMLITLARPKEMDEDDEMLITVAKSRYSRQGNSFPVKVDFEYMKLVDISENSEYVSHMNGVNNSDKMKPKNMAKKEKNINEEFENTKELDL